MKRQFRILTSLIMMMIVVTGCSDSKEPFDDKNIIFKVVETQTSDFQISKSIEVTNQTGFDLVDLTMKLSYLLKTVDTYEDETSNSIEGFSMKSGETLTITIPVHIGAHNTIDLDNPELEFNGSVIQGFEKVPFGIVGSLIVITDYP